MNKKLFIFFCIIILNINAYTQQIHGKIINSITKEPLPFSTIIIKNDKLSGAYANEDGEFIIIQKIEKDTLIISCIGYLNKEISIKEFLHDYNSIIELTPTINQLPTFIASNINVIPIEIGFIKLNKSIVQGGIKGGIVLVRIPNEYDTIYHKITSLNFTFAPSVEPGQKHNNGVVRIKLYDCDSNTYEPSQNLLPEDVILTIPNPLFPWSKDVINVDISKYNIQFPSNGIFLGLEWLGEKKNNLIYNISPVVCYSRDITEYSSRSSFFGRKFINTFDARDKRVPMFGITIK
jgi:hypothetical protein